MALLWETISMQYVKIVQTGTSANWWFMDDCGFLSSAGFDRKAWAITASSTEPGGSVSNLKDGNESTRWSNGAAQANGQWVQVDMGATETFNQVVLDNATDTNDYPRGYTGRASANATN